MNGAWYQAEGRGWENPGGALTGSPVCWGERPMGTLRMPEREILWLDKHGTWGTQRKSRCSIEGWSGKVSRDEVVSELT